MVAHLPQSPPASQPNSQAASPAPSQLAPEAHAPETQTPDFAPRDPQEIQAVLDLFTDPDLSLRDIAEENNTTIHALSLWLARPDIAEQLLDLECASVRRARFNISFALPKIANALSQSLEQATAEAEHLDRLAKNFPCFTLRLRYRENIRKSVAHLLRISGFDPTAKHRSENERRRRDEQTARWRERVGLSMLDTIPKPQSEQPNPKSDSPSVPHSEFPVPRSENPQSQIPNPKSSPSSHPPSDIPHPTSPNYMLIAADEHGRTNIRGLTIPPELNQPGMPFTPVFDDPSDPFVPSVLSTSSNPPEKSQAPDIDEDHGDEHDDHDDDADQDPPFDFSNFSILSTRILAALELLGPELTDVEVAHGMILVQRTIDELGKEIVGLPFDKIVEKVSERLFKTPRTQAPPFISSA